MGYRSYDDHDREARWAETCRLKDLFTAAAQVRPATAEHYQAWLEAHLDNGGKIDGGYAGNFRKNDFVTVSQDATLPPALYGSSSMNIIVPPGVTLTVPDRGHCDIFIIDGGKSLGFAKPKIFKENIASMVDRGYALPDLLSLADWTGMVQQAASAAALGKDARETLTEGLSGLRDRTTAQLDNILKETQAADIEGRVRKDLGLNAATPLDPAYQQVIDDTRRQMEDTIRAQRYKNDPSSTAPLPSLLKPKGSAAAVAKAVETATAGTDDAIQVRKPLVLKTAANAAAAKPAVQESAPAATPAEAPQQAAKPFWKRIFG
jgi:hypothetical protein